MKVEEVETNDVQGLVVMIKHDLKTGRTYRYVTHNIVTDDGDQHYAEKSAYAGGTVNGGTTYGFTFSGDGSLNSGVMVLGTAGTAPAKAAKMWYISAEVTGSRKTFDSGYPTALDTDSDNPLSGTALDILTFRTSYTTAEANDTGIDRVAICQSGSSGTNPILMVATFASSVNKTSSDTLKVIVNHTFNGT